MGRSSGGLLDPLAEAVGGLAGIEAFFGETMLAAAVPQGDTWRLVRPAGQQHSVIVTEFDLQTDRAVVVLVGGPFGGAEDETWFGVTLSSGMVFPFLI
jgi:hypothetical protein